MKKIPLLLSEVCIIILLISCGQFFGNNEGEIIEEYTSGFTQQTTEVSTSSPGDTNFDASKMLEDYYIVASNATLVLTAPSASSYTWTFMNADNTEELTSGVNFLIGHHSRAQTIMIYMEDAGILEAGNTYRLTLTIKTAGGAEYTDSCGIVIYDMLDHKND